MDGVSYALDADPDAQEWVPDLATKIRTAIASQSVDPAPALPQRIALGVSQGIGDPIRAFDMLRQVFASQEAFQRLLGHDYSRMATPAPVEYTKNRSKDHTPEPQSLIRTPYAASALKKTTQNIPILPLHNRD